MNLWGGNLTVLERMSLSLHKDSVILRGGILVTAMVGLEMRMTMDIDTSIPIYISESESLQTL